MSSIPFYFDFQSPYSYLAWKRVQTMEESFFSRLDLRPLPMGTLIHSYETKGPAEIPAKRDYLTKVWLQKVKQRDLPVTLPKLPFNSLYALRLSTRAAWSDRDVSARWNFVDDFFAACWERGEDIGDPENVKLLAHERGLPEDFVDRATAKEVRKEVKENLKGAQESGVFGVPSWIVGDEVFWGEDSLESLRAYLSGEELYDPDLYGDFLRKFSG